MTTAASRQTRHGSDGFSLAGSETMMLHCDHVQMLLHTKAKRHCNCEQEGKTCSWLISGFWTRANTANTRKSQRCMVNIIVEIMIASDWTKVWTTLNSTSCSCHNNFTCDFFWPVGFQAFCPNGLTVTTSRRQDQGQRSFLATSGAEQCIQQLARTRQLSQLIRPSEQNAWSSMAKTRNFGIEKNNKSQSNSFSWWDSRKSTRWICSVFLENALEPLNDRQIYQLSRQLCQLYVLTNKDRIQTIWTMKYAEFSQRQLFKRPVAINKTKLLKTRNIRFNFWSMIFSSPRVENEKHKNKKNTTNKQPYGDIDQRSPTESVAFWIQLRKCGPPSLQRQSERRLFQHVHRGEVDLVLPENLNGLPRKSASRHVWGAFHEEHNGALGQIFLHLKKRPTLFMTNLC